ncbi:hypothetical protein J14TS2_13450 [Bacillus sp. J14TS2]|uniref:LytTR family DNA-binding domain-containing protein n=1 Tax=Bacillus sp. J14TS2 TaxID=2807188 RepID=UPI001B081AEB|nr:LytTR family DNA-binding domain-containing protein [Bacillus sp. J14TS2]GIN70870.1 hypothetical protein J14TS2_13450 [Bacillus sp. J14TS2]
MEELIVNMEISDKYHPPRVLIQANNTKLGNHISEYIKSFEADNRKISVKYEDGYILLDSEEIVYCEIYQKILTVYTDKEKLNMRKPLIEILKKLDSKDYIQNSKASVVNIHKIKRLEIAFSGNYYAFLSNGLKITVSRRFVGALKKRLGI